MITCAFEDGSKAQLRHVVVDNILLNDGKILFVKRAGKLLETGKWGLVGGFIERDETIKEAIAREVMEETGYQVSDITLLRIIDSPKRPAEDRQNIAFIHFCSVGLKIGHADGESSDQRWFPVSALPKQEEVAFDHYSSILLYIKYLEQPFQLPVFG